MANGAFPENVNYSVNMMSRLYSLKGCPKRLLIVWALKLIKYSQVGQLWLKRH